jgi:uncharacterized membrane protein YdbT with pleckstrin-like domain
MSDRRAYAAHPAMFRNNPLLFILFVVLIPVFGVGLILLGIWYLVTITDHISIEGDKVRYSHGLLSKDRTELDVAAVRSVTVRQTFLQRIFDTGDLLIFSAGDQPEIVIKGVPHPHEAKALLS